MRAPAASWGRCDGGGGTSLRNAGGCGPGNLFYLFVRQPGEGHDRMVWQLLQRPVRRMGVWVLGAAPVRAISAAGADAPRVRQGGALGANGPPVERRKGGGHRVKARGERATCSTEWRWHGRVRSRWSRAGACIDLHRAQGGFDGAPDVSSCSCKGPRLR